MICFASWFATWRTGKAPAHAALLALGCAMLGLDASGQDVDVLDQQDVDVEPATAVEPETSERGARAAQAGDDAGNGAAEPPSDGAGPLDPGAAAGDGLLDPGAVVDEGPLVPVTRLETLLEMDRLSEEQRSAEALPLAEQLIELTEEEFGAQSLEAAEAYQRAARLQREAEEHVLAEENYLHAIELVRNIDGTFSERAIEPLIGLGDNYHSSGQYLNAITAYNEARTINRRVFGLLNEGQVPILDKITDSFQELNQYPEADEQQLTILHLAQRNYAEGTPEYLEGIYRYAAWLRESGRYHEERAQYASAIRLIRDMHGKDSALLVRPLRETGISYREQRLPQTQGVNSLQSALEILEQHENPDPVALAETLRDLGDWEIAFNKVEPDLEAYRRAWRALGEAESGAELREQWFGQLHNVLGEPISQRGLSRDPNALRGHVVVQFDLDRYGRTHNVAIAESEPSGFKDDAVARAVRRWRFRPYMVDGEVVEKTGLALQFNYRYLPDEQEG